MPTPALPSLQELENAEEFLARHIGIDAADEARMLPVIGSATRAELIDGIVPAAIRRARPMRLPAPVTEADALSELKTLASKNKVFRSFIGQGRNTSRPIESAIDERMMSTPRQCGAT